MPFFWASMTSFMVTQRSFTVTSGHWRASWRMLSRVTPGRMSPRVSGAVAISGLPVTLSRKTKKMFMAPTYPNGKRAMRLAPTRQSTGGLTSVHSWLSPYSQRIWFAPYFLAACCEGKMVGA